MATSTVMKSNNLKSEIAHIQGTLDAYGQAYITTAYNYEHIFGISENENYKVVKVSSSGSDYHVYVKLRKQDNTSAASETVDFYVLLLGY